MSAPTPGEFAAFDQAHAEVSARIDNLTTLHADVLAEGSLPREVNIVGLGRHILAETDHESCAELMAVAIDRLLDLAAAHDRAEEAEGKMAELEAKRTQLLDELAALCADRDRLRAELEATRTFLDWLIALDQPESEDRRTVNLNHIIARASNLRTAPVGDGGAA